MMVKEYRTSWKACIPSRPDDLADYYMNDEPEDENADDDNGDISEKMDRGGMDLNDSSIDSDDNELGIGS
jgi:hypothetical protein